MIEEKLAAAFESQIGEIARVIEAQREALAAAEDRDQVRVIQHRIALLDAFKAQVEEAQTTVIVADGARIEGEKKFARWLELLPQVRAGMDEVAELERKFPLLEEMVSVARGAQQGAQARLSERLANRLTDRDYPTKKELDREAAEIERLQRAEDAARARVREAMEKREACRSAWFAASEKLNRLRLAERMNRPPEPENEHATQVLFSIR